MLVDTGYGIYHDDVVHMLADHGINDLSLLKRMFISHADADHSGGPGSSMPNRMRTGDCGHRGKVEPGLRLEAGILDTGGSVHPAHQHVLQFLPSLRVQAAGGRPGNERPVPDRVPGPFRGDEFEVLESLVGTCTDRSSSCSRGGHALSADSLIGFDSLTPEREEFNILAKNLMTSVNVDSEKASRERKGLLALAAQMDADLAVSGKRCIICGGHGAISVLESGKLKTLGKVERYKRKNPEP